MPSSLKAKSVKSPMQQQRHEVRSASGYYMSVEMATNEIRTHLCTN